MSEYLYSHNYLFFLQRLWAEDARAITAIKRIATQTEIQLVLCRSSNSQMILRVRKSIWFLRKHVFGWPEGGCISKSFGTCPGLLEGQIEERERKIAKKRETDPITDLGRQSEFLRLESLVVCFTNAFLINRVRNLAPLISCLLPIGDINPSEQAKVINKDC